MEENFFKLFTIYRAYRPSCSMAQNHSNKLSNTLSTESPMWKLVKIAQAFSEKKTLKKKQDGGCGGHLGRPTGTTLANFDLAVILLLLCKFQLKSPKCLWGDMLNIGFQDGSYCGHLRYLISKIVHTFDLQVILLLQCKFQLKPSRKHAYIILTPLKPTFI